MKEGKDFICIDKNNKDKCPLWIDGCGTSPGRCYMCADWCAIKIPNPDDWYYYW